MRWKLPPRLERTHRKYSQMHYRTVGTHHQHEHKNAITCLPPVRHVWHSRSFVMGVVGVALLHIWLHKYYHGTCITGGRAESVYVHDVCSNRRPPHTQQQCTEYAITEQTNERETKNNALLSNETSYACAHTACMCAPSCAKCNESTRAQRSLRSECELTLAHTHTRHILPHSPATRSPLPLGIPM